MAQARFCERCGATFPLTDKFYNRVRLYYDDPETRGMRDGGRGGLLEFKDIEICHNCAEEAKKFLKIE